MRSVVLRPLAVFTITFYVISCILFTAGSSARLLSAVIFSFLTAAALLLRAFLPFLRQRDLKGGAILCACFLFAGVALSGAVSYCTFDVFASRLTTSLVGTTRSVEGTVGEVVWDGGYSAIYVIDVDSEKEIPSFSCVLLGNGGVPLNSTVSCTATFSPLESSEAFDEKRYYNSKGILLKAESDDIEVTGERPPSVFQAAGRINHSLSHILYEMLGDEKGGFAAALLLGNKSKLSDTVSRDFARLGISHVLAISGTHLTVLCTFVSTVLTPFGKRAGQVGGIIVVVFYMFITGLSPAIVRSGIMFLVLMTASLLRMRGDSITNLGVAVFLICAFDPFAVADIGLQLSFCAVAALCLYTEKRRETAVPKEDTTHSALPKRILSGALTLFRSFLLDGLLTAVIVLFMLPLEWLYFGRISLISPIVGPVFSIAASALLWVLPVLLLLSPAPTLGAMLSAPVGMLIELICRLSNKLSLLRGITLSLNFPLAPLFSVIILLSVILFCITKRRARIVSGLLTVSVTALLVLSCFLFVSPSLDRADIYMLSYKSNDSAVVYSDNRVMVIDVGNGYSGNMSKALESLSELQTSEVEVLMLTHLHNAYPSTLNKVFEKHVVRTVLIPDIEGKEWLISYIFEVADRHGVKVETYTPGDVFPFEDASVKTFPHVYMERSVQPVISFEISAFGESLVYFGGAYFEASSDASFYDADVVWLGDHGPLYKKEFSPAVSPAALIYADKAASQYLLSEKFVTLTDCERISLTKED